MTWRETSPMEERIRFVKNCRSGLYEMSELCDRYGISRKTGYKWLGSRSNAASTGSEASTITSVRTRRSARCPRRPDGMPRPARTRSSCRTPTIPSAT